ncbi:MAG: UDP-N-acetylmuramate dehydrogenase [Bacilli bacterium]|nr:UDP-N-acetylmuramate dehydrogenase [Bacilli bacterium]
MNDIINEIKNNKIGKVLENIYMKNYTTYKIGGKVRLMVYPKDVDSLIKLMTIIQRENIDYKIVGEGSNIIFSDKDYNGIIIKLDNLNNLKINDTIITVGAGYNLMRLAIKLSREGLAGLDFATGIPGSVGGAVYMNAGAYKSDMGYIVSAIKVLTPDLEVKTMYNNDLEFKYRTSFLQKNPGYICLEATIVLRKGNKDLIKEIVEDRKQRRLMSQPLEYPSAGSVFRNPEGDYAGRLIEECGLKGKELGGAMVSQKHANFIINYNNASASDVKDLITLVKDEVYRKFGIELKVEQEFVNWE